MAGSLLGLKGLRGVGEGAFIPVPTGYACMRTMARMLSHIFFGLSGGTGHFRGCRRRCWVPNKQQWSDRELLQRAAVRLNNTRKLP